MSAAPGDFVSLLQRGPLALETDDAMSPALPADPLASSVDFVSFLQQELVSFEVDEAMAQAPLAPAFPVAAPTVLGDAAALLEQESEALEVDDAPVMALAPVLPVEPLSALSADSALQQRAPVEDELDESTAPDLTPADSLSLPGLLPLELSSVAVVSLPFAEGLSALSRVLPTPTTDGDETADAPEPTVDTAVPAGESALMGMADPMLPPVSSADSVETPFVEVVAETSRTASEAKATLPPPEPLDVVRAAPPDDTYLRFQRLTHDQLTLRIEDADGAMDVEVSREQAALQVRIVAPAEAIPELMGLGNAIEGALLALGLELGSFTTASRDDEPTETVSEDPDGEGSESETEDQPSDPNRLLDMVV